MTLLDEIHSPEDLKKLDISLLSHLAEEIRERILHVMSINGGHLASNLGSVEFLIALHYVFDSPQDRFVFDVGHQTYTHKLLTGRNNEKFDLIRKQGGLSGFPHPKESPHDTFFSGHAGTALSLALGMIRGAALKGSTNHIIPVIGDASLTCGLSLEALNNIAKDQGRLIVILNDNEMSISQNVGGITHVLSRLLNNPTTSKISHEIEALISKIPVCGSSLAKKGQRVSESLKNLVSPAPFFEQFNLSYIGPIDGHDLKKMIAAFEALKNLPMPVVVHLFTKKGHGVERAENDPIKYHGAKPFDRTTCEFLPNRNVKPTFPKIFGKQMLTLAKQNPNLVVVTPAMTLGSCLDPFKEEFATRCFDVGIAEGHAVTFSGGLAKTGALNVVCSIYATFFQRALDNLFQDVCLQGTPVVFAVDRAGLAAGDGATHHGIYEISFLQTMPNMVICQPRNGQLLKELLCSSFAWQRPTAIRYPNMATEEGSEPLQKRALGKAEILAEGDDLLIIALGHQCEAALTLHRSLLEQNIHSTVVDPIFVKPLDTDLFERLFLKHSRIVTIEEHSLKGGLGSAINAFLIECGMTHLQVLNFGIPELFIDHGNYHKMLHEIGLSHEKMLARIVTSFSFAPQKHLTPV